MKISEVEGLLQKVEARCEKCGEVKLMYLYQKVCDYCIAKEVLGKHVGGKMDKNEIREKYRPDRVKAPFNLLIIGESPPKDDNFFYYCRGSLFECTRSAFKKVFGDTIGDKEEFLRFFQGQGCYVEDLCEQPTNHLGWKVPGLVERIKIWKSEVGNLANKLERYNPSSIFIAVKGILPYVSKSIEKAKAAAGQKWQLKYQESAGFPRTKADPDGSKYTSKLSNFLSKVFKTQEPSQTAKEAVS